MKKFLIVTALTFGMIATPAHAVNWQTIVGTDGQIMIDTDTVINESKGNTSVSGVMGKGDDVTLFFDCQGRYNIKWREGRWTGDAMKRIPHKSVFEKVENMVCLGD
jgi:hypothetical protein